MKKGRLRSGESVETLALPWMVRDDNFLEKDLWRAVLIQTFRDCEFLARREQEFLKTGNVTSWCENSYSMYLRDENDLKIQKQTLEYQIRNEWIQEICGLVGLNYEHFYQRCSQTLKGLS